MLEEICLEMFKDALNEYFPQYLTGELSFQEAFEKMDNSMVEKCENGEYDDLFKQEFDKLADIKEIGCGDKKIFVIGSKEQPVKVAFENPTWQLIEDKDNPLVVEF